MLIDFNDPASLTAWIAQAPARHRALLEALAALEGWAPWRSQIYRATRGRLGAPTSPSTGRARRCGPT